MLSLCPVTLLALPNRLRSTRSKEAFMTFIFMRIYLAEEYTVEALV